MPIAEFFCEIQIFLKIRTHSFADIWKESPKKFEPLSIDNFPEITHKVIEKLSSDAKYLNQLRTLVKFSNTESSGNIYNKICSLCHLRWLTLASRVLRVLYCEFRCPTGCP